MGDLTSEELERLEALRHAQTFAALAAQMGFTCADLKRLIFLKWRLAHSRIRPVDGGRIS